MMTEDLLKTMGAMEFKDAMRLLVAHCEQALRKLPENHPARVEIELALVSASLCTAHVRNWTPLSNAAILEPLSGPFATRS